MSITAWYIVFSVIMFVWEIIWVHKLYKRVGDTMYESLELRIISIILWGMILGAGFTSFVFIKVLQFLE